MEPMLETIDLDCEESQELLFRVKVEGAEQAPAKIRLVCESENIAYMFDGHDAGKDGLVQFNLPVMKDKLKEGVYQSRVEVLIENRYFAPVQFQINFKKTIKVMAESVSNFVHKPKQPEITVTAAPVVVEKPTVKKTGQESLRTRYGQRQLSEDAVLEAAKLFVKDRRKK